MPVDVNFMVGGEAGQGVQSVSFLLAKTLVRGGYYTFVDQDYESRIKGGHNFSRVRVKNAPVNAIAEPVDMLLALNQESIDLHRREVTGNGVIVFDGEKLKAEDDNLFSVPLTRLAEAAGDRVMANTVALGVALGLTGYDFEVLSRVLLDHFGVGERGQRNVKAARAGYDYAGENYKGKLGYRLGKIGDAKRMLITGNEAIALGAIAAGCKFLAGYPMTPSTPIIEYMASKSKDFDLAVVQPEDEIAAVNMVIGAGYAGVRAMTATSGGGFCLMVEGLGLAGMTETPIVIIEGQRSGPAIGLPTRMEQGDLEFVLHASHGEFPRAILAPTTAEDAFWLTIKAFNLAEKFQIPVIILTDHYIASNSYTTDPFDLSGVTIDRGLLFAPGGPGEEYKRHKITASGISPRAFPGEKGVLVMTDSDEHDEAGHLIEDAETRTRMMDKRMRKLSGVKHEIAPPELYGARQAGTTLIGWGSTHGAIREAVGTLRKEGLKVNHLHLTELWPFPAKRVADVLNKAKNTYVIESNATGQLAHLIRAETGKEVSGKILKYDGRPLTPAHIVREVKKGGV